MLPSFIELKALSTIWISDFQWKIYTFSFYNGWNSRICPSSSMRSYQYLQSSSLCNLSREKFKINWGDDIDKLGLSIHYYWQANIGRGLRIINYLSIDYYTHTPQMYLRISNMLELILILLLLDWLWSSLINSITHLPMEIKQKYDLSDILYCTPV